jgi:NAD(P)-dependent dehydrogenase (short-subunit alcohol dehydrogenase family)
LALALDVTDEGQIDRAVKAAEDKFGRIDVLVNNAGVGYFAAVEESEEDQVRRMFEINLFGLGRMIQTVLPGMRKRRHGFIINFSSIAGLRGSSALGYYCATKFEALRWMNGKFNDEYPRQGVVFAVGNQAKRPQTWQLLGVIRLDEMTQGELAF